MTLTLWIALAAAQTAPSPTPLVHIPGGVYRPLYPPVPGQEEVEVPPFEIEAHPVTVGQYRAFVQSNPKWSREGVPALFANAGYLAAWEGAAPPPHDRPITEVSWYAARAYCESLGRRLPTEDEWELVARASTNKKDASTDEVWLAGILAWYGQPSHTPVGPVAAGLPNAWGVHDMHGLVWEWVEDFNNALVSADAREAGDEDRLRFCGVGAISARDVRDYANFMRVAWRSALEARTTTRNLGFRCAADGASP
jgi:sulfatase modifying factor 1